jgi:hypothetical protein
MQVESVRLKIVGVRLNIVGLGMAMAEATRAEMAARTKERMVLDENAWVQVL